MTELFTIGHSNYSIETFIRLLHLHGVTALADVRSHPHSRYLPHFNQAILKQALFGAGIRYVFLGRELGARAKDRSCYVDGKAVYEKIAATKLFSEGIQRVLKGSEDYKISLMCAEKDPITCHRAILVCRRLYSKKFWSVEEGSRGDNCGKKRTPSRVVIPNADFTLANVLN